MFKVLFSQLHTSFEKWVIISPSPFRPHKIMEKEEVINMCIKTRLHGNDTYIFFLRASMYGLISNFTLIIMWFDI